jgi:hypothetical protein
MRRSLISVGLAGLILVIWPASAMAATLVPLATAGNYAVLAGTTITNSGPGSWVSGEMGLSPGSSITGFPPSTSGHQDVANPAAVQAKADLTTAFTQASGQGPCTPAGVNLGGLTLSPGVYCNGTMGINTGQTLTLDGGGSTSGVWIFQIASTLITQSSAVVSLINGAQPCDIFWVVGSSATLNSATTFVGNIMALTDIGMFSGATLNGRAMARNGQVTLITNRIIQPSGCGYSAPTFVAGPVGTTLPATLGIPWELINEIPWLLMIAVGAGFAATVMVVSSRRRRRRTA